MIRSYLGRRLASSSRRTHSYHPTPRSQAASTQADQNALPPPIRVSLTKFADRGVFATRPIAAGEVIHSAKPLLTHPSLSLIHRVCYNCLRRVDSPQSSDFVFCSNSCMEESKVIYDVERKADWSTYIDLCRAKGLKYPLMVKRMACMVISGATSADSLDILQPASLHPDTVKQMEEEFLLLKDAFIRSHFKEETLSFLTKQWYINVLARIRINAFRIELVERSYEDLLMSASALVTAEASVGNAIYILPSFYNHDCDPNTHIVWIENASAKLKALRDIEEGEELCICYIDTSMDFEARQNILAEGFGFQCQCLRCISHD